MITSFPNWKLFVFIGSFILAIFAGQVVLAQDSFSFRAHEDSLSALCSRIWKSRDDSSRIAVNSVFFEEMKSVLSIPKAFNYPFDSIDGISKLRSDDGKMRIITWNVPLNNGTFLYFGFVETSNGKITDLVKNRSIPLSWEDKILGFENWYGAVYYNLITTNYKKKVYYTLLGWDGNNGDSDYKLVDIVSLDSAGVPRFGKSIFKTSSGIRNRVIIEYAERANTLLRYDYQTLMVQKRNKVKPIKKWMIITDRLIPGTPDKVGIRKYYVPAGDTYDAYIFEKGYWLYVEDVMAGNTGN